MGFPDICEVLKAFLSSHIQQIWVCALNEATEKSDRNLKLQIDSDLCPDSDGRAHISLQSTLVLLGGV